MRSRTYRGHRVIFEAQQNRDGEWIPRATIVVIEQRREKRIPIYGRRRGTFDTQDEADVYAFELAKMWINGRTWGTNGHG
jgi:hypothetical protein